MLLLQRCGDFPGAGFFYWKDKLQVSAKYNISLLVQTFREVVFSCHYAIPPDLQGPPEAECGVINIQVRICFPVWLPLGFFLFPLSHCPLLCWSPTDNKQQRWLHVLQISNPFIFSCYVLPCLSYCTLFPFSPYTNTELQKLTTAGAKGHQ